MNAIRAFVEGGAGSRAKVTAGGGGGGGGSGLNLLGENGRAQPNIRSDANVLDPKYILSTSTANRIGLSSDEQELQGPNNSHAETSASASTSTAGAFHSEADSEHLTTEQSADSSSSSPSSSRASSSVSGIGYWTSSSSGRSFDSSFDGGSETSLDGPPHAPPPRGQANGLALSPISNANASHAHNASMASPGLGENGAEEDEDLPALSEVSYGHSSDTSGTVGGSQQEVEEIEQSPCRTNEDVFPLQEDADEKGLEEDGEDTGTNLHGEDDHSGADNSSDPSLQEPTPFAIETAVDKHWTDGKKFPRGATILGIRLRLSKKLYDKGKRGVDACNVLVQTKPRGPYHKYARRQNDCGSFVVDLLRDMGHHRLLAAAVETAYRGDARTHEVPGGAKVKEGSALVLNPCVVMTNKDGIRVAYRAFCFPDSMHNLLDANGCYVAMQPWTCKLDFGIFLRQKLCDEYGMILSFDDALETVNQSNEFPLNFARCTNRRFPGIDDGNFEHKLEYLLDVSVKEPERMFVLQCVSKDDASTGHYVGLANGTIYDNDASSGGKFNGKEYADKFLSGVKKAAEIIVLPPPSKKRKKKKKRKAAQQQENEDTRANKKARLNV